MSLCFIYIVTIFSFQNYNTYLVVLLPSAFYFYVTSVFAIINLNSVVNKENQFTNIKRTLSFVLIMFFLILSLLYVFNRSMILNFILLTLLTHLISTIIFFSCFNKFKNLENFLVNERKYITIQNDECHFIQLERVVIEKF